MPKRSPKPCRSAMDSCAGKGGDVESSIGSNTLSGMVMIIVAMLKIQDKPLEHPPGSGRHFVSRAYGFS